MKTPLEILYIPYRETEYKIFLKTNNLAKRLILKADPVTAQIILVKPQRTSKKKAIEFAIKNSKWIENEIKSFKPKIDFIAGSLIPILGEPCELTHIESKLNNVSKEGPKIIITCKKEDMPEKLRNWIKQEAKEIITNVAKTYSDKVSKKFRRLSIKEMNYRWGSCSKEGNLNFSWRIFMTPRRVFDYIIAHEVAHLVELNHSMRFWKTVDLLNNDRLFATKWLKENNEQLHRYDRKNIENSIND